MSDKPLVDMTEAELAKYTARELAHRAAEIVLADPQGWRRLNPADLDRMAREIKRLSELVSAPAGFVSFPRDPATMDGIAAISIPGGFDPPGSLAPAPSSAKRIGDVEGDYYARLRELAVRLVAPGSKACAVSASECHEITDGVDEALDELGAYRAMLRDLLASAHPHPVEHPTMSREWTRARALLAKYGAR